MKRWIKGAATAAAVTAALTANSYRRWRQETEQQLRTYSHVARTKVGLVEYGRYGSGPVVLLSHGAPGGYDQGFLLEPVAEAGFAVLTPSRPGYLRTPLTVGQTPARQADAFAALLDVLHVDQIAVVGASAGGPAALQFALRHPQRIWALVLEAAVTQPYQPPEDATNSALGRLFFMESAVDVLMWGVNRLTHRLPGRMLAEYLQIESTYGGGQIERCVAETMRRPEQVEHFLKLMDSITPFSLRKPGLDNDLVQLAALLRYPLAQIDVPTLVLHSPYDNDAKFANAEFAIQTIPHAELCAVDAAGHFLWFTNDAERVHGRRIEFLRAHAPTHGGL